MGDPVFDNFDGFEDYFNHDLEKSFSSDIACCDHCYAEFLLMWPYALHADNGHFQTREINLNWFYETGYLRHEFSKNEFDHYVEQIECPRCGNSLANTANIWAYNFPFDIPDKFEESIQQVSELARSTPFLLLEHKYCRELLLAIRDLSDEVPSGPLSHPLFRARSTLSTELPESIETFDFPPAQVVKEGRYNHSGAPVLYVASDKDTCHSELRGGPCLVLEFQLLSPIRILDLTDPFAAHQKYSDLLNSLVYSALVSARQSDDGWHKPHYVVSRFVADCARAAGFDAIKYPSTRRTESNFNLVLVNPSISLASHARVITYHYLGLLLVR